MIYSKFQVSFIGTMVACWMIAALPVVAAPPPRLVKEIFTQVSQHGSNPGNFHILGDHLFFTAYSPTHGNELWKSDGTAASTMIVKDIHVGSNDSSPSNLIDVSGHLYFIADDGRHGNQLWRSDGSAEGTTRVTNLPDGILNPLFSLSHVVALNGEIYFSTQDSTSMSYRLWKTDGTGEGTVMLKEFGAPGGLMSSLKVMNGAVFALMDFGGYGASLWKSDGTPQGTVKIKDFNDCPWTDNAIVNEGSLYFGATGPGGTFGLWKSDGTTEGTVAIKEGFIISHPHITLELTSLGDLLLFRAESPQTGIELWKTDGTPQGTVMLKDINPEGSGDPSGLIAFDGFVYFGATTINNDPSPTLWRTDGTEEGTNIFPGAFTIGGSPFPSRHAFAGTSLYFFAIHPSGNSSLWKTDGTAAGTLMLRDGFDRFGFLYPSTGFKGFLYFSADDGVHGNELWLSDGTVNGTTMLKDTAGSNNGPVSLQAFGDGVAFNAIDETGKRQLWKSDGSINGTTLIKLPPNGSFADYNNDPEMSILGNVAYYTVDDGIHGRELWKSDGTEAGTSMVRDITPGPLTSNPHYLITAGSRLYFIASDSTNRSDLWAVDENGSAHIVLEAPNGVSPDNLQSSGGALYFTLGDSLWKIDDGIETPVQIWDRKANKVVVIGNNRFLIASEGSKLWKQTIDASSVPVPATGSEDTYVESLMTYHGDLYFVSHTSSGEKYLKRCNGADGTVEIIKQLPSGTEMIHSRDNHCIANGTLFFLILNRPAGRVQCWRSDGTEAGTHLLDTDDLSMVSSVVSGGNALYFCANDGIHGEELWQSDGTNENTRMIADLTGDSGGSWPHDLTMAGSKLYFTAATETHGRQLYIYEPGYDQQPVLADANTSDLGTTSVTLHGSVNSNGSTTTVRVDYGLTSAYGSSVFVPLPPTDGNGSQNFTITISGLEKGETYYFRYAATNIGGTRFNDNGTFNTFLGVFGNREGSPKITSLASGWKSLDFQVIPNRPYRIQRTTTFSDWETIATRTADAQGLLEFTDEDPPQPKAFYRLALPE